MASQPSQDATLRESADRFLGTLLDAPADARRPMLDALKTADPELFALVDSLFAHFDDVDDFLAEPIELPADDDAGNDFIGMHFGHWQVVKPIGRGGMGLVFEVERADGVVRQRAALKLIKRSFDNRSIVARFHTERQILAQLDHPSIARLIDAGASDDRPYLVMEYVDGVPLDRWCADHALSIDARIELFNRICAAVHYAHQRLIVHRDLKPSNILITADGTPKLLDFGISKLVGAEGASAASAETIDASALFTPRYASPEQLSGAPISTASDVYSLGVLLFELLTGTGPHRAQNDSLVEMIRVAATEQATRASLAATDERLARRLRGDLDLIVAKALAREPGERYESVAALRDDLVRHLDGDPIVAAPASWRYRATKFVTKHRSAVAATAIFVLALASLAIVASWEALRADQALVMADEQRTRAEQRFEDTHSLAKAMLFDVNDAIATGPTKAREQLVRTALTYLDRLSRDRLSPELQRDVASGYERISQLLGNGGNSNLGRPEEAKTYLRRALAIRTQLAETDPDNRDNLAGLVSVNSNLGSLLQMSPEVAAPYYRAATRYAIRYAAVDPDDVTAMLDVFQRRADEITLMGSTFTPHRHRHADAVRAYRQLVGDMDAYAATHADVLKAPITLLRALYALALLEQQGEDLQVALATLRRTKLVSEQYLRDQPDNPVAKRSSALVDRTLSEVLIDLGNADEAWPLLRRSFEFRQAIFASDPANIRAELDVAGGYAMLGFAYEAVGQPTEALNHFEKWAFHAERLLERDSSDSRRWQWNTARYKVAEMHLALGQAVAALVEARRVEDDTLKNDGAEPADDKPLDVLGNARLVAARSLAATGKRDQSFALALTSVDDLARLQQRDTGNAENAQDAGLARIETGKIGLAGSRSLHIPACKQLAEGITTLSVLVDNHQLGPLGRRVLGQGKSTYARCVG